MARKPKGMHPEEIKSELRMLGGTMKKIAEQLGYTPAALSMALKLPWPSLQIKIAKYMKREPYFVWPDFFNPDGTPVKGCRVKSHNITKSNARNIELRHAA